MALVTVACVSGRVTQTARSAIEQLLLARSLERALARLLIIISFALTDLDKNRPPEAGPPR